MISNLLVVRLRGCVCIYLLSHSIDERLCHALVLIAVRLLEYYWLAFFPSLCGGTSMSRFTSFVVSPAVAIWLSRSAIYSWIMAYAPCTGLIYCRAFSNLEIDSSFPHLSLCERATHGSWCHAFDLYHSCCHLSWKNGDIMTIYLFFHSCCGASCLNLYKEGCLV